MFEGEPNLLHRDGSLHWSNHLLNACETTHSIKECYTCYFLQAHREDRGARPIISLQHPLSVHALYLLGNIRTNIETTSSAERVWNRVYAAHSGTSGFQKTETMENYRKNTVESDFAASG
jgi:hypothetical protein